MKRYLLFIVLVVGFVFIAYGQDNPATDFEIVVYDLSDITWNDLDTEVRELLTHLGFRNRLPNGLVAITKYIGRIRDVRIPERINGMPITHIGDRAFQSNQLTSITLPDTITYIDSWAFSSNQLTSITLPNSITHIENFAFWRNPLTRITLPDNVDIQPHSFPYISVYDKYTKNGKRQSTFNISLSTFNDFEIAVLDNSVAEIIGYNGSVRDVRIPARINGLPVIAIGNGAFSGNQLTSIILPDTITHIGDWAFSRNQLTSINLPNSITHIGNSAFRDNQLTSIILPDTITHIGNSAFSGNQLTSITLPDTITHIGSSAFIQNQLTSVVVPNSVVNLPRNAFDNNVIITRR